MSSTATTTKSFEGTYETDKVHSVFGFSVVHNELSTFRGTLSDVDAKLVAGDDGIAIEGAAKVASISITEPEQFRSHVLGEEFFDADNNPEVRFSSTKVELSDDGSANVEGDLTIAGKTKSVTAAGTYKAPRDGMGGDRAALELETTFDRRDFGFDWQMETPGGAPVLAWDVTLEIHLELLKPEEA